MGELLGSGGAGSVHRALERATGREVALKRLRVDGSAVSLERFLREARLAASLEHPGIVRAHRVGIHAGQVCIVYELVDGEPLGRVMRTLDLRRRVELVRDAARAVAFAHAAGVVHRDLKGENILVDREGRVRVTDFGVALVDSAERLTRTGGLVGTPAYMAPELFSEGARAAGPASDVWSLGVVLYEALTGRRPFEGETLPILMARLEAGTLTPPRAIDGAIPRAFEAVCLRALSRDLARRHADAAALVDDLERALAGDGSSPRRLAPLLLLGAAAVALAATLLGVWASTSSAPTRPSEPPTSERPPPAPAPAPTPTKLPEPAAELGGPIAPGTGHRWATWVDATRVVTGGLSEDVRLWDVGARELLRTWTVRTHTGAMIARDTVLVASEDAVHRIDLTRADVVLATPTGSVHDLAAASSAARAVAILPFVAKPALLLDEQGHVVAEVPAGPTHHWRAGALSPDGALLALALEGGVQLFDASKVPVLVRRWPLLGVNRSVCFAPDGRQVFVGNDLGQVLALDVTTDEVQGYFVSSDPVQTTLQRAHELTVVALAVTPDGRRLVSLGSSLSQGSAELALWDVATRSGVGEFPRMQGDPDGIDVSPDGSWVVVGDSRLSVLRLR